MTVAALEPPKKTEIHVDPRDLEITKCRGSGAGGQHRNVTDSAVQVKHLPSGIIVRSETERSQHQNKEYALEILRIRLLENAREKRSDARNSKRKDQVGTGMRADKVRTIALQRDQVTDHVTGKKMRAKQYLRGQLEDLW